jgi:signal transduction histidine kinase
VVATGVTVRGAPAAILVAASLDDAAELTAAAGPVLGLGLPALLAIVGLITWFLTGRALAPVEGMRAEAEQISAGELQRRLPVPAADDEIGRLAHTLNAMLGRLESASLRQRRFVADASHELRSPLATLRSIADTLDREGSHGDEAVADIRTEVDRLQHLVDDLLFLAREDETPPLLRAEVDLDQTIRGVAAELRRGTDVAIDTAAVGAVRVVGDPGALERIVRNLAANAVRHARSGVWIEAGVRDGDAVIAVSDDGSGIPEARWESVFERFVRLDEARGRSAGGAGLGLSVVRAATRAHGGEARVVASRRGGTTVEVRIPSGSE